MMADLQGGSLADDTNPDEVISDVVDMEFLQEQVKGDESFVEELEEKLRPLCVFYCARNALLTLSSARFRRDERTWRHRLTGLHRNWRPLIGNMADAYLRWKYPDNARVDSGEAQDLTPQPQPPYINDPSAAIPLAPSDVTTASPPAPNDLATTTPPIPNDLTTTNIPVPALSPVPQITQDGTETESSHPQISAEVEILVIDIYTLSTSIKFSCPEDQTTASTLASLGFIGNAPFHPSVAVSVKTLELYRILRRRKPSFSVEAFVKVVCDLYMVCDLLYFLAYSHILKGPISSQASPFIFRCLRCIPGSHKNC